jgi:hypothetical protein
VRYVLKGKLSRAVNGRQPITHTHHTCIMQHMIKNRRKEVPSMCLESTTTSSVSRKRLDTQISCDVLSEDRPANYVGTPIKNGAERVPSARAGVYSFEYVSE